MEITNQTQRNGLTTVTVDTADGERQAMLADRTDKQIERHILPALRRLGGGRYAALEDAMLRDALPAAVARDLHRLLRQAEDKAASSRRNAMQDFMRGRIH